MTDDARRMAETRLATYGTLAPGRVNAHQLDGLTGVWRTGVVRGRLTEDGWGSALGYPGLHLDPDGEPVEVHIFESSDLPAHWPRLDAFEGDGYRRVETVASTDAGDLAVSIYALRV